MGDFSSDGCSDKNGVQPVVLRLPDVDLLQIFPLSYNEKNHCTMLGSPSEGGLMQFDNKVRQPSTVQFTGIVKYRQRKVFAKIRSMIHRINLEEIKCQFQTKSGEIKNMIIESLEEDGESSRYDGIEIKVSLLEYLEHNVAKKS